MSFEQGFLKIDIDGFHTYLDKISDIVDIFYKKSKDIKVNFTIQNHKIVIVNPEIFINKIEIDHKSIFVNYNNKIDTNGAIAYYYDLVNDIFKAVKFKCTTLPRIGHATHYILQNNEQKELMSKMFSSNTANVLNFNDLLFQIQLNNNVNIQKILNTPIDAMQNKQILMLNVDYVSVQTKFDDLKSFLEQSIQYFDKSLFEGLYA